jgi:hypothetical protein
LAGSSCGAGAEAKRRVIGVGVGVTDAAGVAVAFGSGVGVGDGCGVAVSKASGLSPPLGPVALKQVPNTVKKAMMPMPPNTIQRLWSNRLMSDCLCGRLS